MKVEKTKYYSLCAGELADGCKQCVKGEKLVLFVTGLCPARCDFCPVSDRKLYKDVVYANERPLDAKKNRETERGIIEEAEACSARGAGVTGGDPLVVLDRTISYILLLKKRFGKEFHIHLYTPLNLVTEKNLKRLYKAGLDEIRFHLDLKTNALWERLNLAKKFDWNVGVEIPVIPYREEMTRKMINFIKGKVDFLNLNELELADNAVWKKAKDVKCKDGISYAIMGSEELAKKLITYSAKQGIMTHFCTCKLKDSVQLAERIKRRAKHVKLSFDKMTKEGMLIRGALYLPEFIPGFGYHEKILSLQAAKKRKMLNKLKEIREELVRQGIPKNQAVLDDEKIRILIPAMLAQRMLTNKRFRRGIVTEYPTYDALELEVEMLDDV